MGKNLNDCKNKRKEFFNDRAGNWLEMCYPDYAQGTSSETVHKFKKLFSLVQLNSGDTVADIGSGSGILVNPILERIGPDGTLIEIDYAEEMIKENKRLHPDPRIRFITADIMHLPVEPKSCDAAIAFCCFPHFENQKTAIKKIHNILKPCGLFAIAHFDSSEELNSFHHSTHQAVMHDSLPPAREAAQMVEESGFIIERAFEEPGFYLVSGKAKVDSLGSS